METSRNREPSRRAMLGGSSLAAVAFTTASSAIASFPQDDPEYWSLVQAAAALHKRRISSEELTRQCLQRIHHFDKSLNTFITITPETALAQAKASDQARASTRNRLPVLHGVPIALKDNIDTADIRTTAASRVFLNRVPAQDAEVARRLQGAGAVLLGKLNLDEMAFEGTGTTSCFGPVHNPWNPAHITGGSSAGSAAALAAGFCYASVGSDDGGSVRIPAAYCGIVGFKTSYGRVSTRGIVPSAYSLDTVGPMTRSAEDAAIMLQFLAGFDGNDSIVADRPVPDYLAALHQPISHLRVGVPRSPFFEQLQPDVAAAVERSINLIRPWVKEVRDVVLPSFEFVENGSYDVELLHYQAPFFKRTPELYHPWSRRQLTDLQNVTATAYVETLKRLRECRHAIRSTWETLDVLLLPTRRDTAATIEETVSETYQRPPSNNAAFNRFGTPALSVPCGFSHNGLPIGLQIVGPIWGEERVLALGHHYQQHTDWHLRRPTLHATA